MDLPLDRMSLIEKLQIMEVLWDHLCRHEAEVPSPDWHGDVLGERQARINRGEAKFSDWDEAQRRIREQNRS